METFAFIPVDILAFAALFLGIMFTITAAVGGFFPQFYRNRRTGQIPRRTRLVAVNLSVACVFYLSVVILSQYM